MILAACGVGVVALAVCLRLWIYVWLQRTPIGLLLLADAVQVLIAYVAVYRLSESLVPAALAGFIVATSPQPLAGPRELRWRASTSLLHTLALLAVLRALVPGDPGAVLGPSSVVLMALAVLLIALLYAVDTRTTIPFALCCGTLSLVLVDIRFLGLALAGAPVAILISRGTALRLRRPWMTPTRDHAFGSVSLPGRAIRLVGQYPFFLVLLALPVSQIPWPQLMFWWAATVVGWALLTMVLGPLRWFESGSNHLQFSVFPTAFALAMNLNDYQGSTASLVIGLCAVVALVFRALPEGLDPATPLFRLARVLAGSAPRIRHVRYQLEALAHARRHVLLSILLFAIALPVYAGDLRYRGSTDTRPAELLPIALLRDHSLTFDSFGSETNDLPFDFVHVNDHVVSAYPIVPGLVNVPLFVLAGWSGVDLLAASGRLSAITAAIVSATSVVLMFALLCNLFRATSTALLGALLYAFGTCVWSVASKAMWQHGPSLLFILAGLTLLTSKRAEKWLFVSGVVLGLAVWNRPTNIVFLVAITLWWLWQKRTRVPVLLVGAAVPIGGALVYSWVYLGRLDTFGQLQTLDTFRGDLVGGVVGLLASPNRGLFVFTPVFVLSLVGAVIALKHRRKHSLSAALGVAVLVELLIYGKWLYWWGGVSFGYRLIIETIPALVILAAIAWEEWARFSARWIAAATVLAVLSVYVQWLGATYYPCGFNVEPNNIDEHPERLWDVRDGEISRCTARAVGSIVNEIAHPNEFGRVS